MPRVERESAPVKEKSASVSSDKGESKGRVQKKQDLSGHGSVAAAQTKKIECEKRRDNEHKHHGHDARMHRREDMENARYHTSEEQRWLDAPFTKLSYDTKSVDSHEKKSLIERIKACGGCFTEMESMFNRPETAEQQIMRELHQKKNARFSRWTKRISEPLYRKRGGKYGEGEGDTAYVYVLKKPEEKNLVIVKSTDKAKKRIEAK